MFVYILHFDDPLSHAQHYVGMTGNLRQRLEAHAAGTGARLTEVLHDANRPWNLAGLFQTTATNARRVERNLKDSKNLGRYCDICNKDAPAPHGAKRYPLSEVKFPKRSTDIDPKATEQTRITIREGKDAIDELFAETVQKKHKVELGFLNRTALWTARTNGKLHIAELNEKPVSFCVWTLHQSQSEVTIHQCATLDEARMRGVAAAMINAVAALNPTSSQWCKVREDLPANYFWEAIGFDKIRTVIHKTSGQALNQYHRKAIRCETPLSSATTPESSTSKNS